MPFLVTADNLAAALENSKEASSVAECDSPPPPKKYWPVITPGTCPPLGRLPLKLTGADSTDDVYSGTGQWTITGDKVQIFAGPSGGSPISSGKVAMGTILYAQGQQKGTATLTWTLNGDGSGEVIKNPAQTSLLVTEPKPLMTLLPKTIGVKGANAKLRLSANMAFDKGTLTVISGAECIQLLQANNPIAGPQDFTATTELDVKAIKGSTLEGVEFQWALQGVAETVSAKLTVVQATLKIYNKLDAEIGSKQRIVYKDKSRAKVVVECQPADWAGRLRLGSGGTKVKLYTNPAGTDGETATAVFDASATPKTLHVQGVATSATVWDTTLTLDLVDLANGVDEAKITVIETALEVSKPRDVASVAAAPNAKVQDFGTGAPVLSAPLPEPTGEVALYKQSTQFRARRALVRVKMTPKDAPCKLILRPVQAGDKTTLFPEANERHRQGETASVSSTRNLTINAGGIPLAENARVGAHNDARYGAEGYVLWADGTDLTTTGTPTIVQLDVEAVDDDCGKVKFNVVSPKLKVEVRRSDGLAFTGTVQVTVVDVATADQVAPVRFQNTIPQPVHPNPATYTFDLPIGDYRITVAPQGLQEKDFRITLTRPQQLPVAVIGPLVKVVFVLDPLYQWIQFIGYKVKTGSYKGMDDPAAVPITPTEQNNAETQAKAFVMLTVRDGANSSIKVGAAQLRLDLAGRSYDQVDGDPGLKGRVKTIGGVDLAKEYAKELEGVRNNIARRKGAQTDIEKRCDVMIEAVKAAYNSNTNKVNPLNPELRSDPTVLKVFVAPEFYFRGQQGAYAVESLHQIPDRLSVEANKSRYKDWLFVFGSSIGYRERPPAPVQEVTKTPAAAQTVFLVRCNDNLAGSLADVGWEFLVGGTSYPITGKQDDVSQPPWHQFTFTVPGVPTFSVGATNLGVWDASKLAITNPSKTAIGTFQFNKAHAALNIQAGWVLKRQGVRIPIVAATKIDNSNWRLTVRLKPRTTVATGNGWVTKGRTSRDHSGTFTLEHTVVTADYPAGNMASKCMLTKTHCVGNAIPVFKLRVAGALPGTFDVADSQLTLPPNPRPTAPPRWFHFDPPDPTPVWDAAGTFEMSPDACKVEAVAPRKAVILTIDFGGPPYPADGWKFQQGLISGLVKQVVDKGGSVRDVVLHLGVNEALDPTAAITFTAYNRSVEIFNVCVVQKGGRGVPASSDGSAVKGRLVEKESISWVDFAGPEKGTDDFLKPLHHIIDFYDSRIRATARDGARRAYDTTARTPVQNLPGTSAIYALNLGDERDDPLNPHTANISERSASGFGGGSLFELDGVSFGLEVCLDHHKKRLALSGAPPVKVQLVPSCGMSIQNPSKHMMVNGFIFNLDGSSTTASVAQMANGTAIAGVDTPFVSTVAEYDQLFVQPGAISIHPPRQLIPPLK